MLAGEIDRQKRLKAEIVKDAEAAGWIEERHLFQNYKQLQFLDTLALYFNRAHPSQRAAQEFEHVPVNARQDVNVTIRPRAAGICEVSPYPFAANAAEFALLDASSNRANIKTAQPGRRCCGRRRRDGRIFAW